MPINISERRVDDAMVKNENWYKSLQEEGVRRIYFYCFSYIENDELVDQTESFTYLYYCGTRSCVRIMLENY